jgi:L-arabinonolactonase
VVTQQLYRIDILEKAVYRLDPASGRTQRWSVPNIIGSMANRQDGNAIVALANGVHALDFATGECRRQACHPKACGHEFRHND